MKKITFFILTIFTVATLYAAARPSLDGRAVVADSGTMPRGLFARTVGYLPGDSVTVTNPATGSTIDVLILGAIDPSEGVAILLSPEAAEGLRIKPNSNVQVKLTKRSGSLDENANGSAVLSEEDWSEPDTNIAAFEPKKEVKEVKKAEPKITESPKVEEPEPDYEEIPAIAAEPEEEKTPEEPVVEEIAKKPAEQKVVGTIYEEVPPLEEEVERVVVIESEKAEPETEKFISEEKVVPDNEFASESSDSEDELVLAEEETPAYDEEPVIEKIKVTEAEDVEKLQPVIVVETDENPVEEELEPAIEEIPVLRESKDVKSELVYEDLPEEIIEEEPVIVVEEIPAHVEELPESLEYEEKRVAESENEDSDDVYQPIILVPAAPNPPIAEEKLNEIPEEEVKSVEPVEEKSLAIETKENTEKAAPVKEKPVEASPVSEKVEIVETVKPVVSNDWSNYVVPSFKNLRSGSYYVQVASLGNSENIKAFVDKYSTKYPVVLVQNSAKNGYQVMVGPLNIDEYGSIGEKFKAYGFKDLFVRKIR